MKKITLGLLIVFFAAAIGSNSMAQVKNHVVKFNPFGLIVGNMALNYEHVLNDKSSAVLGLSILSRSFDTGSDLLGGSGYTTTYSGFGVTPEYRYYITNSTRDVPKGAFVAPFLRYFSFTAKSEWDDNTIEDSEVNYSTIGVGATIGYQWLIGDAFAIDLYIGPWYRSVSVSTDGDVEEDDDPEFSFANDGVGARFGFALGVAF